MKIIVTLFVVLSSVLYSCNSKSNGELHVTEDYTIKKISYRDFPDRITLTGNRLNELNTLHPRRIFALKNFLILTETKADTIIHIFDKSTLNFIRKVGVMGSGPGEIQSPWGLLQDDDPDAFWAQQLSNKMLSKFKLSDQSVLASTYFQQDGEMFQAVNIVWSSDTTLIGIRADGVEKFVEYSTAGKIVNSYGTWNYMLDEDLPYSVISSLHQGKVLASRDKNFFLLACLDRDIIEILDKKTGNVLSVRGPIHHTPDFKLDNSPGYPMTALNPQTIKYCYVSAHFGDQLIYLLFSGHSYQEIDVNKSKFCEQIIVINTKGEVVKHYALDTSIKEFTVDESERKFYGISIDEDPGVIVFDY